jgi:hypothetical protein
MRLEFNKRTEPQRSREPSRNGQENRAATIIGYKPSVIINFTT